jgi:shikimate kinase
MNIILIGFKSCGKSTVGAALAQRRQMSFIDTDTLVEQAHTARGHAALSFRAIFRQFGQDYFFDLERQALQTLEAMNNYVIAAGGGTFINHPVTEAIRRNATFVYLDVAPEILMQRIIAGGVPAFFAENDFQSEFQRIYAERQPIYLRLADHVSVAGNTSVEELVEQICSLIQVEGRQQSFDGEPPSGSVTP